MKLPSFLAVVAVLATTVFTSALAQLGPGRLQHDTDRATIGSLIRSQAYGLEPQATYALTWQYAEAEWLIHEGDWFGGVTAVEDLELELLSFTTDADGRAEFEWLVPDGYGYIHNTFVRDGAGDIAARQGMVVQPTFEIWPTSGPVGTPITIRMTGIGYRFYDMAWHLLYDGGHVGWMNAVTTRGTVEVTIPATGGLGMHTLQAFSGANVVPYLNRDQSAVFIPQIPIRLHQMFEITEGDPVLPKPLAEQSHPRRANAPFDAEVGEPTLHLDFASGTYLSPVVLSGAGFEAGRELELVRFAPRGSRVTGAGFSQVEVPFATVTTDQAGRFSLDWATPEEIGGVRHIVARYPGTTEVLAETDYTIDVSVHHVSEGPFLPGQDITITLKGGGWKVTDNTYFFVLDNSGIGYACSVASTGDITVTLAAPGQPGMHYLSLYPLIYNGEVKGPGKPPIIADNPTGNSNQDYLMTAMMNGPDHPDGLPVFTIAFEVVDPRD